MKDRVDSYPWSKLFKMPDSHMTGSSVVTLLPVIVVMIAALVAVGGNSMELPTRAFDNPLRYADWAFWTTAVISCLFYGWMMMMLYRREQTRSRWKLWVLLMLPVIFATAFVATSYGQGGESAYPAAFLGSTTVVSTIGALAAAAGCSRHPEYLIYGAPFLLWMTYETGLANTEASYVPPVV